MASHLTNLNGEQVHIDGKTITLDDIKCANLSRNDEKMDSDHTNDLVDISVHSDESGVDVDSTPTTTTPPITPPMDEIHDSHLIDRHNRDESKINGYQNKEANRHNVKDSDKNGQTNNIRENVNNHVDTLPVSTHSKIGNTANNENKLSEHNIPHRAEDKGKCRQFISIELLLLITVEFISNNECLIRTTDESSRKHKKKKKDRDKTEVRHKDKSHSSTIKEVS